MFCDSQKVMIVAAFIEVNMASRSIVIPYLYFLMNLTCCLNNESCNFFYLNYITMQVDTTATDSADNERHFLETIGF